MFDLFVIIFGGIAMALWCLIIFLEIRRLSRPTRLDRARRK